MEEQQVVFAVFLQYVKTMEEQQVVFAVFLHSIQKGQFIFFRPFGFG